jgi:hypothetical protein
LILRVKKKTVNDENLLEKSEYDDQALQQKRHKTFKEQNNHSNRRENEHDHRSHEKRTSRNRKCFKQFEKSNFNFLIFSQ